MGVRGHCGIGCRQSTTVFGNRSSHRRFEAGVSSLRSKNHLKKLAAGPRRSAAIAAASIALSTGSGWCGECLQGKSRGIEPIRKAGPPISKRSGQFLHRNNRQIIRKPLSSKGRDDLPPYVCSGNATIISITDSCECEPSFYGNSL